MTIPQQLHQAVQHHSAGRFAEAEKLYRRVLERDPKQADALRLFGALLHQRGDHGQAAEFTRRAIQTNPNDADAHTNLSSICRSLGDTDGAVSSARLAVQLQPQSPEAHNNLGVALKAVQPAEALAEFQQALQLRPNFVEAMTNLGNVLIDLKQFDAAITAHQSALDIRPSANAWNNLGLSLRAAKRNDEAIAAFSQAVQLNPNSADAAATLGDAYLDVMRYEEAVAAYGHALSIDPNLSRIFLNYGVALRELNQVSRAIAAHRRAVELQPQSADAHFNRALTLLLAGEYADGWCEHEWRWQSTDFTSAPRNFTQPMWDGSTNPAGKTILIHAEQGFGDTLQFVRYAPLADRGAKVIVECQPALVRLLGSLRGVHSVIARGDELPAFDLRIAMMSLPMAFGTTLQNLPSHVPYLHADPDAVARWRDKLADTDGNRHIGLAWAGNPNRQQDTVRSISLSMLAPLAQIPGVHFHSLQKGDAATQASQPPPGMRIIDHSVDLNDFADTAALVSALDLVICVDTAAAHLAGALGKPAWILLPFAGGWRWLTEREDSPWYPTIRLFRQTRRGEWSDVIQRVADELARKN